MKRKGHTQRKEITSHVGRAVQCHLFRFLPFYTVALLLFIAACSSIDCPVQNAVYTIYKVYNSDGTPGSLADTLSISTTRRDGIDSVLLNRSVNTASFNLPISYYDAEDTLFFELKDTVSVVMDTVYISKDNTPHFESVDCNISFFHFIKGVRWTRNAIDSIVINNQYVNYDLATEHFHIYFKARH